MAIKDIFGGITFGGILGGWQPILKPASGLPQALASGWTEAFDGYVGLDANPVYILSQQLVNGINYAVIADATLTTNLPVKKTVIVIINVPFAPVMDGKGAKIVRIIDADNPEVPEDLLVLFKKATAELLGVAHKPIAFISSQIVNGIVFGFICQSTPIRPNAVPYATYAKLWLKTDGSTEITFERIPKR